MTEDEAKTKWCPMVRAGIDAGMAVNHHVDMRPKGDGVYDQSRCIGSGCMMWRWHSNEGKGFKGYCGLAHNPYAT